LVRLLPTPTLVLSVGVGRMFKSVCLSVCLSGVGFGVERSKVKVTGSVSAFFTLLSAANLNTNDSKVFKLGFYKWYGFGVERLRLGLWLTAVRRGFKLYECLLVIRMNKQPFYGPLIQDNTGELVLSQRRDLLEQPLGFL